MSDKITTAYRKSKNIYDDVLTQNTWWGKLYIRLFWNGVDDAADIATHLFAHIPDDFSGKLLDVPTGTATFTWNKFVSLPSASITCIDYSEDMLEHAKKRLGHAANISLLQGDVGNMPFEDETFDIVLSMNGFHVFPDKERAFSETHRVLKTGGKFLTSFYISGQSKATDFLANHFMARKGWFSPPFDTEQSVKSRLEGLYQEVEFQLYGPIICCKCIK